MGMQCHFHLGDLPEAAVVQNDTDRSGALITAYGEELYAYKIGDNYWFDVGQAREDQLLKLKTLIRWRVCFRCS